MYLIRKKFEWNPSEKKYHTENGTNILQILANNSLLTHLVEGGFPQPLEVYGLIWFQNNRPKAPAGLINTCDVWPCFQFICICISTLCLVRFPNWLKSPEVVVGEPDYTVLDSLTLVMFDRTSDSTVQITFGQSRLACLYFTPKSCQPISNYCHFPTFQKVWHLCCNSKLNKFQDSQNLAPLHWLIIETQEN